MASIAAGSVSLATATPNAALTSLSKSQVTELSKNLDAAVEQFRSRPLDCGHYRFMQADASTVKIRILSPIMWRLAEASTTSVVTAG
jgi:transposase-like protein